MQYDFDCPACSSKEWEALGSQTFIRSGERSKYHQSRIDFFLDEWAGASDEADVNWCLCQRCGFVCYSPRPSESDVAHKYNLLSVGKVAGGEPRPAGTYNADRWRQLDPNGTHAIRAQDLFRTLSPLCKRKMKILDYGGGSGQLLEQFLLSGHDCDVVDYGVRKPLPGLSYVGPTYESIEDNVYYDLIICSHVFEHLAEPLTAARRLLDRLAPGGYLYIEVPCEIFRQRPRPNEPVTHINFFSAGSLGTMLSLAGGDIIGCYYAPYRTYASNFGLAVKSLVVKGGAGAFSFMPNAYKDTKEIIEGRIQPILRNWLPGSFEMGSRAIRGLEGASGTAEPHGGNELVSPVGSGGLGEISLMRTLNGEYGAEYWRRRKNSLYYRAVFQYVKLIGRSAKSIVDVGGGPTPVVSWFDWVPHRVIVDREFSAGILSDVTCVQEDFLHWNPDGKYDVALCLQVLEHIEDAEGFAKKLMSVCKHLIISVPYKWSGFDPNHIHDPVDEHKLKKWFGIKPNYSQVFPEPFGPSRLIQYYDLVNGPSKRFSTDYVDNILSEL